MSNTDIVARMYEAFRDHDMERLKTEIFHEDVTFVMPGHHPMSVVLQGPDEVVAWFVALGQCGIFVTDAHFGELDDGTVIERHVGHGELHGEKFSFPICNSYEMLHGKLYKVQIYNARQHEVDRFFWGKFALKPVPGRLAMDISFGTLTGVPSSATSGQ